MLKLYITPTNFGKFEQADFQRLGSRLSPAAALFNRPPSLDDFAMAETTYWS